VPPADYRGPGLPRLLPFGKHKDTTVAPPAVEVTDKEQVVHAVAQAEVPSAKPKKEKHGFIHDVLGL
jgi:hypothetical protein